MDLRRGQPALSTEAPCAHGIPGAGVELSEADLLLRFPGLPGVCGHIVHLPGRPVRAVCHCCGQPQRSDGFHNLCHQTGVSLYPHLGHVHLPSHIEVPILAILSNVTFYQFSIYTCFCYCNSCNTNICICSEVERNKKLLGQLKNQLSSIAIASTSIS